MNRFKTLFLAFAVVSLFALPCAAGDEVLNADFNIGQSWGGSGSCLNDYNNCLNGCDANTTSFQKAGCKTDCWVSYYDCVLASAIN
jgi:hypothetical protein